MVVAEIPTYDAQLRGKSSMISSGSVSRGFSPYPGRPSLLYPVLAISPRACVGHDRRRPEVGEGRERRLGFGSLGRCLGDLGGRRCAGVSLWGLPLFARELCDLGEASRREGGRKNHPRPV